MASDNSVIKQLDRNMPVAPLAIIALPSARKMGEKVSDYISSFRRAAAETGEDAPYHDGYFQDSYLMEVSLEREEQW